MLRLQPMLAAPRAAAAISTAASLAMASGRPTMSQRDRAVEQLAVDVFSKGNKILKVVDDISTLPEGKHSFPEVCFVGKPESGKSATIGALCHNVKMGRRGKVAGATKKLEFFNVGDCMLLVDTPGYGAWEKRTVAENTLGITLMRRYITLRKQANLKQVYWVIECPLYEGRNRRQWGARKGFRTSAVDQLNLGPRDEDMLEFLKHEQVPFTVLLSKADRLHDSSDRLRHAVDSVYDFLGTDTIPVMSTACLPKRPDRCRNIHELMCDITEKCSRELRDDELNWKGLHSLSYLPPTIEQAMEAEARYPHSAHVLPVDNNQTVEDLVEKHNAAKLGFVGVRQRSKLFSPAQYEAALSFSMKPQHDLRVASGSNQHVELPRAGGLIQESGDSNSSALALAGQTPSAPTKSALDLADLLPRHQSSATESSSVIGVPIPSTMVGQGTLAAAAAIDQSAAAYAAMVENQGYYGVLNHHEDYFITSSTAGYSEMNYSERRQSRYISHREIKSKLMLDKFIARERKDRSIQLDAQGFMCPWLGSDKGGAPRVKGSGTSPRGGGAMVRDLKHTGFGGNSHSRKTFKNTFRATKKIGFWAT